MNALPRSVLILYNVPRPPDGVSPGGAESDAGILAEVAAVETALVSLGVAGRTAGVSCLADIPRILGDAPEETVFNLVEALGDDAAAPGAIPDLCRAFGKRFTGSDTACLLLTLDKWRTRCLLQAAGLPVPPGIVVRTGQLVALPEKFGPGPYVVKPVGCDASEGLSVVNSPEDLADRATQIHATFGQDALIERYVGSRELNVSVLQDGPTVRVLPLAEIDFSVFPEGECRVVDYAAKWLPDSFAFHHTPRVIPAPLRPDVAEKVRQLARSVWDVTGCRGYARVDFRLDADGQVYILEVNANPDISPDAGFVAAAAAGGLSFPEVVRQFLDNAVGASGRSVLAQHTQSEVPIPALCLEFTAARHRDVILDLLTATGFFRPDEVAVAAEVLDESVRHGPDGDYQSFAGCVDGEVAGWVCYGLTPCTIGTYDIYWLAVAPAWQRHGVGRWLMARAEAAIQERGGQLAVVETSGRPLYDATRRFYLRQGYSAAATIRDFYGPGDAKIIYTKALAVPAGPSSASNS